MSGVLRQWVEKKGLEKYFRRDNLIILVLVGILLFVIALPTDSGGEKGQDREAGGTLQPPADPTSGSGEGKAASDRMSAQEYAALLEERLTEVLSDMEDVGKVRVMITLKSSEELVVERETSTSRSSTKEADAQGGSRTVDTGETDESVVYSTGGGVSEPYVVKSFVPQIEGVLVVAQGAGSGKVNRTVTEIVQALFGVEAHKVKVVRMKE